MKLSNIIRFEIWLAALIIVASGCGQSEPADSDLSTGNQLELISLDPPAESEVTEEMFAEEVAPPPAFDFDLLVNAP